MTKAIKANTDEQWKIYKKARNSLLKVIDISKSLYYEGLITQSANVFKTVESLTAKKDSTIPRRIIDEKGTITSPKALANMFNKFFIDKIEIIRKSFTDSPVDPILLLSLLIPKKPARFHLPEITLDETINIILQMKASNGVGFDNISSNIIKKIPEITGVFVSHIINTSIRQGVYPEMLKIVGFYQYQNCGKARSKKKAIDQ